MSNSLTGIDNAYWSKESLDLDNIKTSVNNNLKKTKDNTFSNMLEDKIKKDGSVNMQALDKREKKLFDSCIEMESLLWKQVLNEMKKTVNKVKLLDGGQAEDIFTDFLYDEYSSMMAKNANTKIADTLFKQLSGYNK